MVDMTRSTPTYYDHLFLLEYQIKRWEGTVPLFGCIELYYDALALLLQSSVIKGRLMLAGC
jgi:hypothetical protein